MDDYCFKWKVKHQWGDKSIFSEYFNSYNYTWRLGLVSVSRPYVYLEYFGYLTFEVFTDYVICIEYADGEKEEKRVTFGFGSQLEFGVEVQPKEKKTITIKILSAVRCYEAKKDTPYTGLINLGATCYLNTIMQTLFHIKGFVKELFKQAPGKKTVQMQKLFYQLGKNAMYADTKEFTHAFKLKDEDIDEQQDIQEFFKALLDELEKEAKGTPFFKYIEDTFYGTLGTTIRCEKGCVREITEKYNDLQLVMDLPYNESSRTSLEDSLHNYISVMHLKEPNLYHCEKHEYVPATKSDYCKTFPPVLFLQIKRFNMDYETGEVYKLNNYYSFPSTLDLSPYTQNKAVDNRYTLYAVNVHQGNGMSEGHYYAYIKKHDGWYKFNDSYVTRCMEEEAIQETFGGRHAYKNKIKTANAYYLVYVRTSQMEEMLNANIEVVPEDVRSSIEKELFLSKKARLEVYMPSILKGYWGLGYFSDDHQYLRVSPGVLELENSQSYNQVVAQVKKLLSRPNAAIDSILLYSIERETALRQVREGSIVADMAGSSLFAIEADKNITKDDSFILFIKQAKAMGQPYDLKVLIDIKSVHVVNKKACVKEWIKAGHKLTIPPFAEISGVPKEIDDSVTFEKLFSGESGVIILEAGAKVLAEYFKTLATHKIYTLVHKGEQVSNYWVPSDITEEQLQGVLERTMESKKFRITEIAKGKVHIELEKGHVLAYLSALGDKTENVNLSEKKAYILPEYVTGEQVLQALGLENSAALTADTKILKAYPGVDTLSSYKITASKISLKDMVLLTVQEVDKKIKIEAVIKYSSETIGYPFMIDLEAKKSAMEIKRIYGLEESVLIKSTPIKQTQIEEMASVRKLSKTERLVFRITYYQKYQLKFTRLYFSY
ncbi:ubiquitin carboxyl-terminal hydrolase 7 [Nematocida major]|uniref:ubiquitin carboxyl-terminal hydrolase 7 n=1 Tax=Nematocida major TaxID=1912982 RepID=UPI0020081C9A|nr:ubiquitin carboxyl-terminal hydrolase 7 [Nematocida major]KAH9387222.1 ubiquitin carboxyl-terminal hydrolase 7 [Nematocida major]